MDIILMKENLSDEHTQIPMGCRPIFQRWVEIDKGKEGVTNYMHWLGAEHIADYLFYWRDLYVHSQQGWENLNHVVKKFDFRRTNQGGGRGDGNRLRPVARWLARRLVWMTGKTFEEIKAVVKAASVPVEESDGDLDIN
jgi:hypothetical protein